jgi:putative ABC transport system permease protein
VLRAVGASNQSVRQVVVVEGVVVGLIAWFIGTVLAVPVGQILATAVLRAVLKANAIYEFSVAGMLIWLALIVIIGIFASLGPARNAVSLSVREVLDYE